MLFKKMLVCLTAVVLIICLCGCDLFSAETEQLIMPPAFTGDMKPIGEALDGAIQGEYTLKYPLSGQYRSPVILNDVDSDNVFEAFTFYSQNDGEMDCMHLNVICRKGEKWESVFDQKVQASGVDAVDFCDLNGDGVLEILIGWTVYATSEKQLAVYSLNNGVLSQRLVHEYSSFICCDFDGNSESELFIHRFSQVDAINEAAIYTLKDSGVVQISGAVMDSTVRTVNAAVLSVLSDGTPAVYIDETKDAGMITEVLFCKDGALANPLLSANGDGNIKTLRTNSLPCADINKDGIMEIPVSEIMASSDILHSQEKIYYTNWCSFNGKELTVKQTTLFNTSENYFLYIPEKWIGNIALIRNNEERIRTVYEFSNKKRSFGEKLAEFTAVPVGKWNEFKKDEKDAVEISRNGKYVFAGKVYKGKSPLAVTEKELKEMFFLYDKE